MVKNILHTTNLLIGHDKKPLSEPINIALQTGDCLAVLGRNGSGKSTLLHTICKLIPALGGEIYVGDQAVSKLNYRELALKISIVFSGRRDMIGQITVEEILKLGRFPYTGFYAKLNAADKSKIEEIVSYLHLEKLYYKNINHLSDGEAQKVMIARALVQDTPLIIFDEPTTHLDLFNKHEIFQLIKSLSGKQKTILISTHEVNHALNIANQCILFTDNGSTIYGNTTTLKQNNQIESYFGELLLK